MTIWNEDLKFQLFTVLATQDKKCPCRLEIEFLPSPVVALRHQEYGELTATSGAESID